MKFLERFTELIKEKNLSITEIAQKTNLPRTTISSYINNRKSIPSAVQLESLANFFDVSIDYLVGREDELGYVVPSINNTDFSDEEIKLIKQLRTLDPRHLALIKEQVKTLAEISKETLKK